MVTSSDAAEPAFPSGAQGFNRRSLLRGIGGIALGGATAAALAACDSSSSSSSGGSGTSGSTGGSKTLTLMLPSWVDAGFLNDVMQKLAADPLGVKLKLATVDDGTYPAQAAAAQKSGQAPDLLFWTAQGVPALQASGVNLQTLDSYVDAHEDKSAFYQADYEANTVNGKLYSLGFRCNCRGLVYRGDFAQAAGLAEPGASWTVDQFGAFVSKLNGSKHAGFGFEAKVGDGRASSNFLPLIWSTGAAFVKQDAGKWTIGFTAEQMQQVMAIYYNAVHVWKSTPKDVANWGYQQTDGNFSKGLLASYSAGPFVLPNSAKFKDTQANLKVAPLPTISKQTTFWEEHSLMMHADSKQQDLAWQFLANMRGETVQQAIAKRVGDAQLSVRKTVNAGITDPTLKGFAGLLDFAVVPEAVNVAPIFNTAILPAIESIALKGTTPQAATTQLMSDMQNVLDTQINK